MDKEQNINQEDQSQNKVKDVVNYVKEIDESVKNKLDAVDTKIEESNEILDKVANIGGLFLESQKVQAKSEVDLLRIQKNHETIHKHIDTEYKKQKQTMDKASDVVDVGLDNNNIEIIREGLAAMTATANHNPLADLKKSLDKDIDKDYLNDDFIIEI